MNKQGQKSEWELEMDARFKHLEELEKELERIKRLRLIVARMLIECCPLCGGPVEGEPGHEGCVWGCWREQTSEVRDE